MWNRYAAATVRPSAEPGFCWTQYPGHGPGVELLGEPKRTLDLGCGAGGAVAYLAQQGIEAYGVDIAPLMVKKAQEWWTHSGATFSCADATDHLTYWPRSYDAIYSSFGAAWFSDPAILFHWVEQRLKPRGVFVFSHAPAIPGTTGPQGMYEGSYIGPARYAYRYAYTPERWEAWCKRAGFTQSKAVIIDAPQPGHIGTLLVTARRRMYPHN
ncbi:SAM-dependent methyltransferase [Streptomyces sp. WAC 06738]|uniref:class I SAM-dependent methyltransferase n=1 Tax=Streptomyces sp. WAC 06738 TaxID=2203210 RepID=UPI000F6B74B2|nr:class I SAM-dependent methyltransferase [Streptomyces sp. WAC 06738]AZM50993.1 SAM-dependent methyltransferase [Streptomyces sp. WAC 06738]